jgi:flagellar biogenesis protein FliO
LGLAIVVLMVIGAGVAARLGGQDAAGPGMQTAAALVSVVGLALVVLRGLQRWGARAGSMAGSLPVEIRILGAVALGEGRRLLVVGVADERFLLSSGRDSVRLLSRLPAGDRAEHPGTAHEGGA